MYKNVFENYTAKQWNIPINMIDKSVINRVPVILGYDDRYFQDKYQYMPKDGYTKVFEKMLNSENITLKLFTNALDYIFIIKYTGKVKSLMEY